MSTIELKEELQQCIENADGHMLSILHAAMLDADTKSKEKAFIEQYNKELDEADAAIDRGEFITQEELKIEMKKW